MQIFLNSFFYRNYPKAKSNGLSILAIIGVKNLQIFQKTETISCTVIKYISSVITFSFVQIIGNVHFLRHT